MQCMDRGSLHNLLYSDPQDLSGERIISVLLDVCRGLQFLHTASKPIVHGVYACIFVCMYIINVFTCIHTYVTYMHACIHTYVTLVHTYTHAYSHTYIYTQT